MYILNNKGLNKYPYGTPALILITSSFSVILILAIDRMELYRRLPIISVEDTSLIEGTSTIVWLMMAGERGPILSKVAEFIVRYVEALCDCTTYFPNHFGECVSSHAEIVEV